jgi:5'-methylthioinosine phosphorylase
MLAIIGGSGFYSLAQGFELEQTSAPETTYGSTSAELLQGHWHGLPIVFLPRHGPTHRVPPHRINYRANIWALKQLGVTRIIAINAVGGIADDTPPLTLVLPDQIIDYTSGRDSTFFEGVDSDVQHIDFSWPYSVELREVLLNAARRQGQSLKETATYGCTNGPRLETVAEILRLRNDGCHIVGMTGMPEAVLARELQIEYASLTLVVNWAAGIGGQEITMQEILRNMDSGMRDIVSLLVEVTGLLKQ